MSTLEMTTGPIPRRADQHDGARRPLADRESFEAFYREHHRAVWSHLARRVGNAAVADDLTSEVFLAALRWRRTYRDLGIGPRPWLYRVASSVAARWLRKNRRRWLSLDDDAVSRSTADADRELAATVRRALARLRERDQAVIALFHLEEMSVREVAAALGCGQGAVKMRLKRARAALRRELQKEGINDGAA
ncbi:MAG: RNA polymerase sigma factor [Planctomycetota bacterium]|nr:MAG: RNA polymerase sigma factor [Planctomycetota bacterium]